MGMTPNINDFHLGDNNYGDLGLGTGGLGLDLGVGLDDLDGDTEPATMPRYSQRAKYVCPKC